MDNNETKVRISTAYEHLRKSGLAHTQQDVANKMDASKSTVSGAFNGNPKCLTKNFLSRFNAAFGDIFSLEWLVDGVGEMLCCPSSEGVTNSGIYQTNVIGDNNASINDAQLSKENEMLKRLLAEKEKQLQEKERTIQILLNNK